MTVTPQTAELLDRLRLAVNSDHRRRSRRRRVAAVAATSLLVVTGAAVAAVTQAPWWQTGSPPVDPAAVAAVAKESMPANVDISRARTVATDANAALVAVPIQNTGYCLITALNGSASLGDQCEYQAGSAHPGDGDMLRSYAQPSGRHGGPAWVVYGRVTEPSAASIDLGAITVQLQNGGFFVASISRGQWSRLDATANPGTILDASGATVQAGCVNWGPSPASPDAGIGDVALWTAGNGPCKPQPVFHQPTVDLDQAQKLVELTLTSDYSIWTAGTTIALWEAPAANGWTCDFIDTASPPLSGTSQGPPSGPGNCDPATRPPAIAHHPFAGVSFSVGPAGVIMGQVDPASGISKVKLRSAAGSIELPFGGGWFLGQLPDAGTTGELPPGGPFTIVGYDANGNQAGSESLEAIRAAGSPH